MTALESTVLLVDLAGHLLPLEQIEHMVIMHAIKHHRGHMSKVAHDLGIGRSTLYRKLESYKVIEGLT